MHPLQHKKNIRVSIKKNKKLLEEPTQKTSGWGATPLPPSPEDCTPGPSRNDNPLWPGRRNLSWCFTEFQGLTAFWKNTSGLQRCLSQRSASGTGWAGLQGQDVEVSACPQVTRTIHLGPHTCILSEQVWVPCLEDNKTIFPAPSFEKKGHYEGSNCPCESGLKRLLSLELISRRFLLTHTTPL